MKPFTTSLFRKTLVLAGLLFAGYLVSAQSDARVRIALNGGWGYRIAKTDPRVPQEARSLIDGIRSGINYGGDVLVYFSEKWGVGAKYTGFNKNVTSTGGSTGITELKTSTQFVGATFGGRLANSATGAIHLALSLGYVGYAQTMVMDSTPIKLSAGSVGTMWDFGYDLRLSEKIAIGAQVSLLSGNVTARVNQTDTKENVSRIDLSAGIRFTL